MRFRKLRIAWSVWWGIVAVLLIVLWAKSEWCADCIDHTKNGVTTKIAAAYGFVVIEQTDFTSVVPQNIPDEDWQHRSRYPVSDWHTFQFHRDRIQTQIQTPIWIPLGIAIGMTVIPWTVRFKRFSLRTLLMATTLVAVVLGIIVWQTRQ
jgi:hypothetical protein